MISVRFGPPCARTKLACGSEGQALSRMKFSKFAIRKTKQQTARSFVTNTKASAVCCCFAERLYLNLIALQNFFKKTVFPLDNAEHLFYNVNPGDFFFQ